MTTPRTPGLLRRALAAALLAACASPRPARATPTFPAIVAEVSGAPSAPPCGLCHVGAQRRGTVETPFGRAVLGRGAAAHDEASLRGALDALQAAGSDVDGDGAADLDELARGGDPNAGAGEPPPAPAYGVSCAAAAPSHARAGHSSVGSAWAVAAALAWCAARARRRRTDG